MYRRKFLQLFASIAAYLPLVRVSSASTSITSGSSKRLEREQLSQRLLSSKHSGIVADVAADMDEQIVSDLRAENDVAVKLASNFLAEELQASWPHNPVAGYFEEYDATLRKIASLLKPTVVV